MTEIFNREAFLQRVAGDEELLQELVEIFLEHAPRELTQIRASLAAGDAPRLHGQAHSFKGAAASIGAEALKEAAARVERAGKAGELNQVPPLLEAMGQEFTRLKQVLGRDG